MPITYLCVKDRLRSVQATLHAIASTIDALREHVSRDLSTKLSEQFGRPVTVTIDVVGKDAADESRKALLNRVNKDILANVALVEKHLDNPTIPERFRKNYTEQRTLLRIATTTMLRFFASLHTT